jgi:3-keto-5-aminohexanoate cleavage enzyme
VFDLSMLYQALALVEEGVLRKPLHVQFVFGVKNAMPAIRDVLEFQVQQLNKLMPDATWTAAGIGRHQLEVNRWSLELGGHCRTGLEDNIRIDRNRLAASNAELVRRVVSLCADHGRQVAKATEARKILGLA